MRLALAIIGSSSATRSSAHWAAVAMSAKPIHDQVIENVAHKVPDVADQARQFAELAMDLPHEMSPTMGDLLAVSPASEGEIACLTPDVADPEPTRQDGARPCNVGHPV